MKDSDALIKLALTHSSYTKDYPQESNNERLEFYGDAVLKLVFSKYLFNRYPDSDEGILTKYRARLISDDLLARVAKSLGLESKMIMGSSLQNTKIPKSVLANAVEAMIAAIYINNGFEEAERFVLSAWEDLMETAIQESISLDYKSLLQEKVQNLYNQHPVYKTISAEGPAHKQEFELGVYIGDKLLGSGKGFSKKLAGQSAAKSALENFSKN